MGSQQHGSDSVPVERSATRKLPDPNIARMLPIEFCDRFCLLAAGSPFPIQFDCNDLEVHADAGFERGPRRTPTYRGGA